MNHPKPEEWVPYIFGEANPEARKTLRDHLQTCSECRARLDGWNRSLKRLDAWPLPRPAQTHAPYTFGLRWAAAAAVLLVLGLGFLLGRVASTRVDVEQLRASIAAEVRQELRGELVQLVREETGKAATATLAASTQQSRGWLAAYARALDARLETEKIERIADCLSLKRDVDTIAINADAGLRHTQQSLAQLSRAPAPNQLLIPSTPDAVHN